MPTYPFPIDPLREFFNKLLDTSDFPARWKCGNWDSFHGWVHIISDIAIWAAYGAIPLALIYFCRKKKSDLLFTRLVLLFACFIIGCGTVHLIEAIIFYHPIYRISALMKFLTALISWITVVVLWKNLPRALELPALLTNNTKLAEELERRRVAEARLELLNGELRMVGSMVAHDLRNPVSSALMMAEVTSEKANSLTPEQVRKQMRVMADSLRSMDELLDSLMHRSEVGEEGSDESVIDLADLMESVKATLSSTIIVEGGTLTWRNLPTITASRDPLFHLFVNLVENALKYRSNTPPQVEVARMQDEELLVIEVRDNGRGISEGDRERVFSTGYRSENSHGKRGRGLGLSFCRRIIEDLGGSISAESNEPTGSKIVIRLPIKILATKPSA